MVAVAGAGVLSYFENARALDDNVLQAMEALSGQQVDGLADFLSVQSTKAYQLEGIKLRGHIGEQEAHDLFADSGLDVSWPPGGPTEYGPTNHPGWDLQVEGTEINVKVVADAGHAAEEHFARYPDIPLIVNADAGNIPEGALHFDGVWPSPEELVGDHVVVVADGLDLAGIEALQSAAAGVEAPAGDDAGGGMIPGLSLVIAATRSALHEGRLLRNGDTDVKRALKNITVDTAVKGGGAVAGGHAGLQVGLLVDAAFGGMLLGMPTLICGAAGAIAGGTAGSKVANAVKLQPLRDAQAKVREALQELERTSRKASRDVEVKVSREVERQELEVAATARTAQRAFLALVNEQATTLRVASTLTPTTAKVLLDACAEEVDAEIEARGAGIAGRRGLNRWWLERTQAESLAARQSWFADAAVAAAEVEAVSPGPFFDHLMVRNTGHRMAAQFLARHAEARLACLAATKAGNDLMASAIIRARRQAVDRLVEARTRAAEQAEQEVAAAVRQVEQANRAVLREVRAVGGRSSERRDSTSRIDGTAGI